MPSQRLEERATRYRKQSGLTAKDFTSQLAKALGVEAGNKSLRAFLAQLEKTHSAEAVEGGMAKVLAEFA